MPLHLHPHGVLLLQGVRGEVLLYLGPMDGVEGERGQDVQLTVVPRVPGSDAGHQFGAVPAPEVCAVRGVELRHAVPEELGAPLKGHYGPVQDLRLPLLPRKLCTHAVLQALHAAHHNNVRVEVDAPVPVQGGESEDVRDVAVEVFPLPVVVHVPEPALGGGALQERPDVGALHDDVVAQVPEPLEEVEGECGREDHDAGLRVKSQRGLYGAAVAQPEAVAAGRPREEEVRRAARGPKERLRPALRGGHVDGAHHVLHHPGRAGLHRLQRPVPREHQAAQHQQPQRDAPHAQPRPAPLRRRERGRGGAPPSDSGRRGTRQSQAAAWYQRISSTLNCLASTNVRRDNA